VPLNPCVIDGLGPRTKLLWKCSRTRRVSTTSVFDFSLRLYRGKADLFRKIIIHVHRLWTVMGLRGRGPINIGTRLGFLEIGDHAGRHWVMYLTFVIRLGHFSRS